MKSFMLVLIVALLSGCFGASPENSGLEGKLLPEFTFLLTDSSKLNTKTIPDGKPLALFFFSPYCPHCRAQTREIVEDIDRLKNIQFCFVSSFSMAELKAYSKEYGLENYPNIIVGVDSANLSADYFEIRGVPYTAIYGSDKRLNEIFMGKIYSSQLKKAAEE